MIRERGGEVSGVSSGQRKNDKETWWWTDKVQESSQRKSLAREKWDCERKEES